MKNSFGRNFRGDSLNGRILRAVLVISSITVFAKIAGVGKELIVASRFGRSDAIDAFLIAFLIPAFVVSLISGSASAAFIPTFVQVQESEGRVAANRLLGTVMLCSQVALFLCSVVVAATARYYLPLVAHGFGGPKLDLACQLSHLLAPYIFFSGIVVIWTAVLNAGKNFAFAAATPIVSPLAIVGFLFLAPRGGAFALALGTVFGTIIEAALLAFALHSREIPILPSWGRIDARVRTIAAQYLPMVAGAFLMGGTLLVDQAMAAYLGSGSVAALSYGSRIVALLTTMGATSLSTAVLPYFSQMVAHEQWHEVRHTLRSYTLLVLALTIPITALLFFYSGPVIRVAFQRGEFSPYDTRVVASVQSMFALQLPFYAMGIIGVRLISSLRKNHVLTLVSLSNLLLHVIVNLVVMRRWGVAGIAVSTSLAYAVAWALIYSVIYNFLHKQERILIATVPVRCD